MVGDKKPVSAQEQIRWHLVEAKRLSNWLTESLIAQLLEVEKLALDVTISGASVGVAEEARRLAEHCASASQRLAALYHKTK